MEFDFCLQSLIAITIAINQLPIQSKAEQSREREREKYQTHSVNSRNHRHGQAHCRSAVPVSEPQSTDQSNWHKTPFHIDDSDATPHRTTSYHTIPHQRLSLLSSSNHGQEQARTLRVQNPNGVRHLAHSFTRLSSIHFGFEAMVVSFCYNDLEQVLVCFTREAGGLLMLLLWVPTAPIATNKQRSLTVVAKSFKFNNNNNNNNNKRRRNNSSREREQATKPIRQDVAGDTMRAEQYKKIRQQQQE
jgi:hypothetical protein